MKTNTHTHHQGRTIAAIRIAGLIALSLFAAATAKGQQAATIDKDGNFRAIERTSKANTDSTTAKVFQWPDGKQEPVYVGSKGAFYLARTSKNGNYYRKYIKTEE